MIIDVSVETLVLLTLKVAAHLLVISGQITGEEPMLDILFHSAGH